MDNARVFYSAPAPDDDADAVGINGGLTARQELFAQALASTGNQAAAYRIAYTVHERTLPQTIWSAASRLANFPPIRARVAELAEHASLETIMSLRQAFQWHVDIATADPQELVRVVHRACRHCYGVGHAYQWADDIEYLNATVKALDAEAAVPSDAGGYGYDRAQEPMLTCPHCLGLGEAETVIADTTKLTGKARKLYKGAKQDRFGCIEILMHDQTKHWELCLRMLGALKDNLDIRTPKERGEVAPKLPEGVTADQAARFYLELVQ